MGSLPGGAQHSTVFEMGKPPDQSSIEFTAADKGRSPRQDQYRRRATGGQGQAADEKAGRTSRQDVGAGPSREQT